MWWSGSHAAVMVPQPVLRPQSRQVIAHLCVSVVLLETRVWVSVS